MLDEQIGLGPIDWRSPLRDDEYAEYRDSAFLERLGITLQRRALETFWPRGGPQWDALGVAKTGETILIEAKAHLNELYSPATGASSESSLALIQGSLAETKGGLGVPDGFEWSKQFYQYANRIAHAYLLNELNGVPAKLVFVYFVGDEDMKGPAARHEWETAVETVHNALGLNTPPPFICDVFIDVTLNSPG